MPARDDTPEAAPLEMSHLILPSGTAVISLSGELGIASAKGALSRVRDVMKTHRGPVVLDVAAVTYCDDHGLRALLRMREYAEQAGCPFRLSAPSPAVLNKIRITGMECRFRLSRATCPTDT